MRQPTASAAKTKQRYKKRSNCKHKKSGCVCFIVARLRASALRNRDTGDNKALCAPTDPTAKLRIHARGTFLHLLPHSARRRVIQFVRTRLRLTHTPARVYAHSAVFRLLPSPFTTSPYFSQYVTIRGEDFAFVRSSPSSPEKRISTHRLFSCKASSVRRLHMGELLHFASFTGTFTPISLILYNLRPVDCSKLGEAKNGSTSPSHPLYSVDNKRIHSLCGKR